MATELGVVYLSLAASTGQFAKDVKKALGDSTREMGNTGKHAESLIGGGLKKAFGWGLAGVAGVGAALTGLALKGGIDRALQIENAQAKMRGLGHDTAAVDTIMDNALKSVKGTSFGLGEAAGTAAAAVAAGIKPGEELERVLASVANSAAASGVSMGEMGDIYTRVASTGKAQNDVLRQVASRGLPIYEKLAEQLGVTTGEVEKMASAGEIGFREFEKAMTAAGGTVAAELGDTFEGRLANARAALSRLGESAANQFLPMISDAMVWATDKFDELGPTIERVATRAGEAVRNAAEWTRDHLVPAISSLVDWVQHRLVPAVRDAVSWLSENRNIIMAVAGVVGAAVVGWEAYVKVTKIARGAQLLLNAAMAANPAGLIVAGIAALVAGLAIFFTQTETGRRIWETAWTAIKSAAATVVDWWQNTASPAVQKAWEKIQEVAGRVADWWAKHLAPLFKEVGELLRAVMDKVILPAVERVKAGWSAAWTAIKSAWDRYGPPIISAVTGAFTNMKIYLETIWNSIKIHIETVIGVIRGIVRAVTKLIQGDWRGAWNEVKAIFGRIWDGIKRQVDNAASGLARMLSNTWDTIKDVASKSWGAVRDSVMKVVDPLVQRIKDAFADARDGVKRIWDGVKSVVQPPVRFVVNTVWNNGLRRAINAIPGVSMSEVKLGFADGGWTGPGPKYKPAGLVHADEHVWTKAEMSRFPGGHKAMERWRRDVMLGRAFHVPGYASGGAVRPVPQRHSGWRGGRYSSGRWHGGLDFPAPTGTPVRSMWAGSVSRARRMNTSYGNHVIMNHGNGVETLYAHMSQLLTAVGRTLAAGGVLGRVGSTGNSTGPHLHLEVRRSGRQVNPEPYLSGASRFAGASVSSSAEADLSLWDAITAIPDAIRTVMSQIRTELKGEWGQLLRTGVTSAVDDLTKWAKGRMGFAGGTMNAPAGWSWVGEHGPELMRMRGGEQILSHRDSMRGDASRSVHVGTLNLQLPDWVKDAGDLFRFLESFELETHRS